MWLLKKVFLRDTAGSPEWVRELPLACSGSQSQCRIWLILPAHGASHEKTFVPAHFTTFNKDLKIEEKI